MQQSNNEIDELPSDNQDSQPILPWDIHYILIKDYFDVATLWTIRDANKSFREACNNKLFDLSLESGQPVREMLDWKRRLSNVSPEDDAVDLETILGLHKDVDTYLSQTMEEAPPKFTETLMEWTEYPIDRNLTPGEVFSLQDEFRRAAGRSGRVPSRLWMEWKEREDDLRRQLRSDLARIWCLASDWNNHRLFPFTSQENKDWKARKELMERIESMEKTEKEYQVLASYNPRAGLQIRLQKKRVEPIEFYLGYLKQFAELQRAYSVRFPPSLTHQQRRQIHELADEMRKNGTKIYTKSFGEGNARFLIAYRG